MDDTKLSPIARLKIKVQARLDLYLNHKLYPAYGLQGMAEEMKWVLDVIERETQKPAPRTAPGRTGAKRKQVGK